MDPKQPILNIVYAAATRAELNGIWRYNEKAYGRDHADQYIDFLLDGMNTLATKPYIGGPVKNFPHLRALTLKLKLGGYGHVAVYRVDVATQSIRILHVYHSAQDIQGRLKKERR